MHIDLHHTKSISAIDRAWTLIMQYEFDIAVSLKNYMIDKQKIVLGNNEIESEYRRDVINNIS